jgi:membrane fusion protein, multidrug efflux system
MRDEKRFEVRRRRNACGLFLLLRAGNALFGILSAVALLFLVAGSKEEVLAQTGAPPEVEIMTVAQKDVPVYSEWVGTTEGW